MTPFYTLLTIATLTQTPCDVTNQKTNSFSKDGNAKVKPSERAVQFSGDKIKLRFKT